MIVLVDASREWDNVDVAHVTFVARFAMEAIGLPSNAEVSVTFVDDAEMADLNARFRGKEGPTDVLSFECDNVDDDFPAASEAGEAYELGDIVIAPDVAARQAEEYGHSVQEEIELLLVHGVLHLAGYDHVDDADAEVMERRQSAILGALREGREDGRHD